jgi:hypothetical protein
VLERRCCYLISLEEVWQTSSPRALGQREKRSFDCDVLREALSLEMFVLHLNWPKPGAG